VFRRHAEIFRLLEVERLLTASMLIRRRTEAAEPITVRRQAGPYTGNAEMEWILQTEAFLRDGTYVERLLALFPAAVARTQLKTLHSLQGPTWVVAECSLETDHPFALRAKALPWSSAFVAACDGVTTVREHYRRLRDRGALPESAVEQDLAKFVAALIR